MFLLLSISDLFSNLLNFPGEDLDDEDDKKAVFYTILDPDLRRL